MQKWFILFLLLVTKPLYSQNWDIRLLREINHGRNTKFDNSFVFVTNSVTPISIATPLAMFGVSFLNHDTLLRQKSVYIGAAIVSTMVIASALKYSVNRQRPFDRYPDIENQVSETGPSFPSGHTSAAFALATSLSLSYPKWYIIVPSYTWASTVAYSRLHLGVHYPTDVLAGALIGAGTSYLGYKGQQWLNNTHRHKRLHFRANRNK
jgi:membrane-associated phospholipid phosphatase